MQPVRVGVTLTGHFLTEIIENNLFLADLHTDDTKRLCMQKVKFGITLIRYRMSLVDKPLERKNYVIEGNVVSEVNKDGNVTVEVTGGCEIAMGCLVSVPADQLYTVFDKLADGRIQQVGTMDYETFEKARANLVA